MSTDQSINREKKTRNSTKPAASRGPTRNNTGNRQVALHGNTYVHWKLSLEPSHKNHVTTHRLLWSKFYSYWLVLLQPSFIFWHRYLHQTWSSVTNVMSERKKHLAWNRRSAKCPPQPLPRRCWSLGCPGLGGPPRPPTKRRRVFTTTGRGGPRCARPAAALGRPPYSSLVSCQSGKPSFHTMKTNTASTTCSPTTATIVA